MNRASFGRNPLSTSSIEPAWVMLHFPPPEIRIFVPSRTVFSRRTTFAPKLAARQAATMPAAPAPTTTTSASLRAKAMEFQPGGTQSPPILRAAGLAKAKAVGAVLDNVQFKRNVVAGKRGREHE